VVKVRDGAHVVNKAAHLAVGVNTDGIKHVLGIWVQSGEGAKLWLTVLTELHNRGVRDVLIACCDGLEGLPEAIETTWPGTGPDLRGALCRPSGIHALGPASTCALSRIWIAGWMLPPASGGRAERTGDRAASGRAISMPWSQVKERHEWSGSWTILSTMASRTCSAPCRPGRFSNKVNLVERSTRVPMAEPPPLPMIRSPLPVSGQRPVDDLGRPLGDHHVVLDPHPGLTLLGTAAGLTHRPAGAQAPGQFAAQLTATLHMQ